ncbi:TetR family transcriptional regulator [Streptomyces coeruleorubidus]|uniref:TetR family transcriptional regulator n=1 Tax=Streptomyces coeruleorubidus TaxID=116188 RepID=UPI0033E32C72
MTDKLNLRERRRLATQAEIENAALDLFEKQGFERTTVDDIAAAAGVSQSTFFRYFRTKEDVALGANHAFEAGLTERLEGSGARASRLRDVEAAVADVLRELSSERTDVASRMLRVRRLVMRDPALRSAALRREAEQCARFLELLAAATGDGAVDTRARVLAEMVSAGLRATFDEWALLQEPGRGGDLVEVYRAVCARLREVVAD